MERSVRLINWSIIESHHIRSINWLLRSPLSGCLPQEISLPKSWFSIGWFARARINQYHSVYLHRITKKMRNWIECPKQCGEKQIVSLILVKYLNIIKQYLNISRLSSNNVNLIPPAGRVSPPKNKERRDANKTQVPNYYILKSI